MLNVPLLAAGEVHLLRSGQVLDIAVWVVLAFVFAYTIAATRGADSIVQFLVDSGARLNVKTKQGFTALDIAMGKNSVAQLPVPKDSTVALLRKLGALEGKDVN